MKGFAYTARDASGKIKRGFIPAADRAAAVQEIRALGLVPVDLQAGDAPAAAARRAPSARTMLIAAAALAAAAALIVALARRAAPQPAPPPPAAPSAAAVPAAPTVQTAPAAPAAPAAQAAPAATPVPAATATDTAAVTPPPAAGIARRIHGAGAAGAARPPRKVVPGIRIGPTNAPNPLATLRTTSERMISQLLRTRPGDPVLPIMPGPDFARDFSIALTNPIVIYETDTPEDAAHKEGIALIKEEMRKMVEQGESPEVILEDYRREMNELAAYRRQLQQQLNELRHAGDMEGAAAFVEEANQILAEYGMRPLVLSPVPPISRP